MTDSLLTMCVVHIVNLNLFCFYLQNWQNNFRFESCKYKTPKKIRRQIVFGLIEEIMNLSA